MEKGKSEDLDPESFFVINLDSNDTVNEKTEILPNHQMQLNNT